MTTKVEQKRQDRQSAIESLQSLLPRDTTVYTVLRHVSRSGMSRSISVLAVVDGELHNLTHLVARALDWKLDYANHDGVKVGGCGMDMGYHLVDSLSWALHGEGYALNHRWV